MQTQVSTVARQILAGTPLQGAGPILQRWFERDCERLAHFGAPESGPALLSRLLECLRIAYTCPPEDRARIPRGGPLVIVANHPFGLAEAPVLWAALSGVRDDIKFLANSFLAAVPALAEVTIPVDPFGGADAVRGNWKSLRAAVDWLREGHVLVVFPAGEVASLRWPRLNIADPDWSDRVARLIRLTGAAVLPVFFHGANSPVFHLAGLIHPRLRTILLPHELLNKRGATIRLSIGSPIRSHRLARRAEADQVTGYLRVRTMLLGVRGAGRGNRNGMRFPRPAIATVPVTSEDSRLLAEEIERLPASQQIVPAGPLLVYTAAAAQIPHVLREIGRLREITFRAVGEGTGKALDIDAFDRHYQHLVLWNREKQEVVGAYRFARTDQVDARQLYTGTLFRTAPGFLAAISPALELGRSFVRAEYQKSYQPLLLLWRAIGRMVADDPRYRFLFGPVSISQEYSTPSRSLMVSYLRARCRNADLAAHVRPRRRFRLRPFERPHLCGFVDDLDELSEMVADLEHDHKPVPVLVRQYLNLGGQILEISVDRRFSNVLDGLVVVDLTKTNPHLLERYLGKAGADRFRAWHGTEGVL